MPIAVRYLLLMLRYAWPSPWTLLGMLVGVVGVCSGAKWKTVRGVFEIHGGLVQSLLRCAPISGGAAAMTLGHVVLGQTEYDLERTREHERVHVRQYERWGLLFIPAYFAASVWVWARGKRAYLDNPFEVEAYAVSDSRGVRK